MKTVAIIPARGGSKSIPRKNIKILAGKPLIAYTIECAKNAKCIDRVIVSTDDPEISAISRQYGAEVVIRPDNISGDFAASEAALLHVLTYLEEQENYVPDIIVFLQCTSPLTSSKDIEETVNTLIHENADSAFAATTFHYFLWRRDTANNAIGINHNKYFRPLRQVREPQYIETGAIYVMRTQGFLQFKHRFFGRIVMNITPPERYLEIDEPVDFEVAEVLVRKQNQAEMAQHLPHPIESIVFDFDGVFTDNKVFVLHDGREAVCCSRSDGAGIGQLKSLNIPMLVISSEINPVVTARCNKLGLSCMQGIHDKFASLKDWASRNNVDLAHTIYIGNDVNDKECLQAVGCGVVVNDAHDAVKNVAKIILSSNGGNGAIRELIDLVFETRPRYICPV